MDGLLRPCLQAGKQEFAGEGEIGMLDWGAYTPTANKTSKGVKALAGGKGRGYSMARTLGSDPNQVRAARQFLLFHS